MTTELFYKNLEPYESLDQVTKGVEPVSLPEDWWVIVADVEGSTKAIESGNYKAVNTVGAATIVCIVNINRDIPIPYVFGGDGATLAVPPSFEKQARCALLGARDLARDGFQLRLRTGMIRVKDLQAEDKHVEVAKYKLSPYVNQPALFGRGWDTAESYLKHPPPGKSIEIVEGGEIKPDADFTGFECRWKGVRSRSGHKLSILVLSTMKHQSEHGKVYSEVNQKIQEIYGDEGGYHPVDMDHLSLSSSFKNLMGEALVRTKAGSLSSMLRYALHLLFLITAGRVIFARGIDTEAVKWSEYRQDLISNTDFKKFDGMLKMVIDGSEAQRLRLESYLEECVAAGTLVYGLHASKEALLTCLIFDHNKDHIHFLDGGDGGYAIAAKQLKASLLKREALLRKHDQV